MMQRLCFLILLTTAVICLTSCARQPQNIDSYRIDPTDPRGLILTIVTSPGGRAWADIESESDERVVVSAQVTVEHRTGYSADWLEVNVRLTSPLGNRPVYNTDGTQVQLTR